MKTVAYEVISWFTIVLLHSSMTSDWIKCVNALGQYYI